MKQNKTVDIIIKYTEGSASHTVTVNAELSSIMTGVYDLAQELDSDIRKRFEESSDY